MPFYIRTKPRRPPWHPLLWGTGPILVWSLGQALLHGTGAPGARLGVLTQGLYVMGFTVLAGAVVGGLYWALGTAPLRDSLLLRFLPATAGVAVYLTMLTLATGLSAPEGPWPHVSRLDFGLSTALISVVFGWLVARDPFGMAARTERVYLTPKEVAAMGAAERERLQLDSAQATDPADRASAG